MTHKNLDLIGPKRKDVFRLLQDARWREQDAQAEALAQELQRLDDLLQQGQCYDPKF